MSGFDDREKAFEDKFAHDAELQFKAAARRNRLVAEWAAGELGITGDNVKDYIISVVKADLEEAGEEDVVRKISGDFSAGNVDISDHRIRKMIEEHSHTAKEQIMNEV